MAQAVFHDANLGGMGATALKYTGGLNTKTTLNVPPSENLAPQLLHRVMANN